MEVGTEQELLWMLAKVDEEKMTRPSVWRLEGIRVLSVCWGWTCRENILYWWWQHRHEGSQAIVTATLMKTDALLLSFLLLLVYVFYFDYTAYACLPRETVKVTSSECTSHELYPPIIKRRPQIKKAPPFRGGGYSTPLQCTSLRDISRLLAYLSPLARSASYSIFCCLSALSYHVNELLLLLLLPLPPLLSSSLRVCAVRAQAARTTAE